MKTFSFSFFVLFSLLFVSGCQQVRSEEPKNISENQQDDIASQNSPSEAEKKRSLYRDYTAEEFNQIKGTQPFVLFFHADWCPTCRNWKDMILSQTENLPSNTLVLEADYDTETELKKMFEITSQTTVVFFDAAGEVTMKEIDPSFEIVQAHFLP